MKKMFFLFVAAIVFALITVVGCKNNEPEYEESKEDLTKNPIGLTVGKWEKGEIVLLKGDRVNEQWFTFVATSSKQRIYVKFGTMNCIQATLCDNYLNPIGSALDKSGDSSTTAYIEKTVTSGATYYIKVNKGNYHGDGRRSYTGTYWIGITDFPARPETIITDLIKDKWANGRIETESNGGTGEQWFKFVATDSTQRIYVKFKTMNCIKATLYDIDYNPIGNSLDASGDIDISTYIEKTVISGETYYIKVTEGNYHYDGRNSYTGNYRIGFTDFPAQPETVITDLSENKWTNGKIETESNGGTGEQWFKFVATDSTQRIYVKFGTMNCILATLYDSDLNPVGSNFDKSGDLGTTAYIEKTVTSGLTYYIKVTDGNYHYDGRNSYKGTYGMAFNASGTEPQ